LVPADNRYGGFDKPADTIVKTLTPDWLLHQSGNGSPLSSGTISAFPCKNLKASVSSLRSP
jgi:hypothetical protein